MKESCCGEPTRWERERKSDCQEVKKPADRDHEEGMDGRGLGMACEKSREGGGVFVLFTYWDPGCMITTLLQSQRTPQPLSPCPPPSFPPTHLPPLCFLDLCLCFPFLCLPASLPPSFLFSVVSPLCVAPKSFRVWHRLHLHVVHHSNMFYSVEEEGRGGGGAVESCKWRSALSLNVDLLR